MMCILVEQILLRVRFMSDNQLVNVIPTFTQIPITVSAAPKPLLKGEAHEMVVTLRCMTESVGDLSLQIKLIKGEYKDGLWTYDG